MIGEFENGIIDDKNHYILEEQDYFINEDDIEEVEDMELEDDAEGRTELKFSGKRYKQKPISNTKSTLKY